MYAFFIDVRALLFVTSELKIDKKMNSNPTRYSLFINSLLSNKEILIKENKDIQITESSVFKHSKTVIPLDLVNTDVKQGSQPDFQWLVFSLVNFVAVMVFTTLAVTQNITFPFIFSGTFALLGIASIFAAYKFKNHTYTFQYDESNIRLFTLTSNDLNSTQVKEFTDILVSYLQENDLRLKEAEVIGNPMNKMSGLHFPLENYSEPLSFLYDEGIIDDDQLDMFHKKIYNKLYRVDTNIDSLQESTNVIPFRSHRTVPFSQTAE